MSGNWTPLEHQIHRLLQLHGLDGVERWILAVSGGLDSMVLLRVFSRIRPAAEIVVAHFHHGDGPENPAQNRYREQVRQQVQQAVRELGRDNIRFVTGQSPRYLSSENDMRVARWEFLRGLRRANEPLVTAHHADDHLETLLLKLIRGTSADGIGAFRTWNGEILRPFLGETKVELTQYAAGSGVAYLEDPSNQDENYLRNWIRTRWIPELEARVPGASANLAQSLFKIAADPRELPEVFEMQGRDLRISRTGWMTLSRDERLRVLAVFLKKHQIHSFTSGQLEEIQKRLDKNQKDITFELLGRKWVINASQIMLQ